MDALTVEVSTQADRVLVRLVGELDDSTAAQVSALELPGLELPDAAHRALALDLAGLDFMDSSGIGALVNLRNRAATAEMTTTVVAAPPHIRHTLAVTGLAALFGLRP